MGELIVRFLVGGLVVSLFASLGQLFAPKTFAGLFGSAPSVAIASLGLTFASKGHSYVAAEGAAMALGALGLIAYSSACVLVAKERRSLWMGAAGSWLVWAAITALGFLILHALRSS